jgi:hypothetical protein
MVETSVALGIHSKGEQLVPVQRLDELRNVAREPGDAGWDDHRGFRIPDLQHGC